MELDLNVNCEELYQRCTLLNHNVEVEGQVRIIMVTLLFPNIS